MSPSTCCLCGNHYTFFTTRKRRRSSRAEHCPVRVCVFWKQLMLHLAQSSCLRETGFDSVSARPPTQQLIVHTFLVKNSTLQRVGLITSQNNQIMLVTECLVSFTKVYCISQRWMLPQVFLLHLPVSSSTYSTIINLLLLSPSLSLYIFCLFLGKLRGISSISDRWKRKGENDN